MERRLGRSLSDADGRRSHTAGPVPWEEEGGEGKRRREKEETSRAREDPVNTGKGRSI